MAQYQNPNTKPQTDYKETLFCWGSNDRGQLGMHTTSQEKNELSPKQFTDNTVLQNCSICDVHCGGGSSLIVLNDGSVLSSTKSDGTPNEGCRFKRIDALETHKIIRVVGGAEHTVVLNKSGQLLSWGDNSTGQLGVELAAETTFGKMPKMVKSLLSYNVIQVACGNSHTVALCDDGRLFTFGDNAYGQLGIGSEVVSSSIPLLVKSLMGVPASQIAAGGNSTYLLTSSGGLFAWGCNSCGQLGVGDEENRFYPVKVKTLSAQKIVYICCGNEHTMALTKDGRVFSFGSGACGQLGHNNFSNEFLPRQSFELMGVTVTQIACGKNHSLAYVPTKRKLLCFGSNESGQLGVGTMGDNQKVPVGIAATFSAGATQGNQKAAQNSSNKSTSVLKKCNASAGASSSDTNVALIHSVIKKLYAGGNHNFVVTVESDTDAPCEDFRVYESMPRIITLGAPVMDYLNSYPSSIQTPKEVKSEVDKIFSSSCVFNGSFLLDNDVHFDCSVKNPGVDYEKVLRFLSYIDAHPNANIVQYVFDCLVSKLFPSLPREAPDMEALRLFLTIPTSPAFDKSENFDLIVPFAKALILLKEKPTKVIKRWWETLIPEAFERLIKVFKGVIVHIITLPGAKVTDSVALKRMEGIFSCLEVMGKLNEVNTDNTQKKSIVNHEIFYISNITEKVDIRKEYVVWLAARSGNKNKALEGKRFCDYPFIFDAPAKTILLHTDALIQMQSAVDDAARNTLMGLIFQPMIDPVNPCLTLHIARDNIVNDTLAQLSAQGSRDFKKPLKVKFQNEEAMDAGGVSKEFFLLLLEELLDPKFGMFHYYEESRLMWFNESTFEDAKMFSLIGSVCGLAIYNSVIINLNFPVALYKKLLKRPVNFEDLKELRPTVARSLQNILEYDGDDLEDTFNLTFEVNKDVYGTVVAVPLVKDGSNRPVTKDNRQEYVDLYMDYVFNSSVEEPFKAFYTGFHRVCGGKVLELFHPDELQEMVVGNQKYDWAAFQKEAQYRGVYSHLHEVIIWFWEVFNDMSEEDKKKFLFFLTGSDRIPIHGMKSVQISIQPIGDDSSLPVAHTCFNLLDLPKYSNKELLRKKVMMAVEHNKGFALV